VVWTYVLPTKNSRVAWEWSLLGMIPLGPISTLSTRRVPLAWAGQACQQWRPLLYARAGDEAEALERRSSACKNYRVANPDWLEEERVERAIREARSLGWSLHVDEEAGQWRVWGAPSIRGTGVIGGDLAGGVSQAEVAHAGMADEAGMAVQKPAQASGRNFATRASRADAAEAGLAAIQQLVRGGGSGR
jgi:hypothetical protein